MVVGSRGTSSFFPQSTIRSRSSITIVELLAASVRGSSSDDRVEHAPAPEQLHERIVHHVALLSTPVAVVYGRRATRLQAEEIDHAFGKHHPCRTGIDHALQRHAADLVRGQVPRFDGMNVRVVHPNSRTSR